MKYKSDIFYLGVAIFGVAVTVVAVTFLNIVHAADVTVNCSGTSGSPTTVNTTTHASAFAADADVTFADSGGDGYCSLGDSMSVASVTIGNGAGGDVVLTHTAENTTGITISTTGNLTVHSGSSIDVDAKGCGATTAKSGPSSTVAYTCQTNAGGRGSEVNWQAGGGASYGGGGGVGSSGSSGGGTYDVTQQSQPLRLGSAGGRGRCNGVCGLGGGGGGLVSLDVEGTIDIDGTITADGGVGADHSWSGGGGSGGSIYIEAGTLNGSGTITADGGNGGSGAKDGGGGGGGRIGMNFTTLGDFTINSSTITAIAGVEGGDQASASTDGTAGTTYILNSGAADALYVTQGLVFHSAGDYAGNAFLPQPGTKLSCDDETAITTLNITAATGNIDLSEVVFNCTESITEFNLSAPSGTITFSDTNWTDAGSSNFALTASTISTGGTSSTFTHSVDGATSTWTVTNDITFTRFNYTGPTAGESSSGGGVWTIDNEIDISLVSSTLSSSVNWDVDNITIDANSSLNANAKGCINNRGPNVSGDSACSSSGNGKGTAGGTNVAGGGGSYGGQGGANSAGTASGAVYGSNTNPTHFGAGGGTGYNGSWAGGTGGGILTLTVSSTLTVNGTLSANGGDGETRGNGSSGGGGAGGTIYAIVDTVAGSGTMAVDGGDGGNSPGGSPPSDGGGGGGGRLGLYYITDTYDVLANATATAGSEGGTDGSATDGADGSVYPKERLRLQFSTSTQSIAEGDTGTSALTVTVSTISDELSAGTTTVDYIFSGGTASGSGVDFTLVNGTASIASSTTSTTFTVDIVGDLIDESDENFVISLTNPGNAASIGGNNIQTVTITDDDTAATRLSTTTVAVVEGGATSSYGIVLDTQPTANVVITPGDANSRVSFSPSSITFTTSTWNTTSTIVVTAITDNIARGTVTTTISNSASSTDANYNTSDNGGSLTTSTLIATITDDDTAGITKSQSSVNVTEGGATSTYTIVLDSEPTADVNISLANAAGEVSLSTSTIEFTNTNWNVAKSITVTANDDAVEEGAHSTTITHTVTSVDTMYDSFAVGNNTANITDNDTSGVSLVESDGVAVAEEGTTNDTHSVVLVTQPTGTVEITMTATTSASQTLSAGFSISPSSLTFTASTWNVAQTVTSTAIDDSIDNAATTYTGTISYTASSSDGNYNGISISNTSVTITDNDTASVTLSGTSVAVTEGSTGSYTIALGTQPTSTVDITLTASSDEASVNTSSITFTTSTWNIAQTITVTATDDSDIEGNHSATITHAVSSTDRLNGVTVSNVAVSITDNDAAATGSGGRSNVSPPKAANSDAARTQTISANQVPSSPGATPKSEIRSAPVGGDPVEVESTGTHTIEARGETTDEELVAIIRSEPIEVRIQKNETQQIDLNADNIPDLELVYLGLNSDDESLAVIKVQELTNANETKQLVTINGGAYETDTLESILTIKVSDDVSLIAFSNTLDFIESSYQSINHFEAARTSEDDDLTTYQVPYQLRPDTTGAAYVYVRLRTEVGGEVTLYDSIFVPSHKIADSDIPCILEKEQAYKTPENNAVYYITTRCTKRPFRNPKTFFSHFTSWSDINLTDQTALDDIPNDRYAFMPFGPLYTPYNGTLVKTLDNPRVFMIINSTKHWIPSETVFNALKFSWTAIKDVSQTFMDKFREDESITTETRLPGMIVRYADDPDIYLLEEHPEDQNQLIARRIANMEVLERLNYTTDAVMTLDDTEIFSFGEVLE